MGLSKTLSMIICSIVLVSLVAGQVWAAKEPPVEEDVRTELAYPVGSVSEELTKEELLEILEGGVVRPEAAWIAGNLSRTMNKDTTVITDGLTVADVLEFNTISPSECVKERLYKREYACRRTEEFEYLEWYCRNCLRSLVRMCLKRVLMIDSKIMQKRAQQYGLPYDEAFWKGVDKVKPDYRFNVKFKYFLRGLVEDADVSLWSLVKASKAKVFELIQDELLTRDLLFARLQNTDHDWVGPKSVAVHLGMAKNKRETEIAGGLTVADLLALNDISVGDCSPEELSTRHHLCSRASDLKFVEGYCHHCVQVLAQFCVRKKPLSFDPFWRELGKVLNTVDYYDKLKEFLDKGLTS